MRPWRILAALVATSLCIIGAAALPGARTASAHPLGNFTINHYDRVSVSDSGIEVYSVLDMAEIPAFKERQDIDANGDGVVDAQESEAYAAVKTDQLKTGLTLQLDDRALLLTTVNHELTFPPGQGGLVLLRLTSTYRAVVPAGALDGTPKLSFDDGNDSDRLGWREIVVRSAGGVRIDNANVPAESKSAELTAYPQDALTSPSDVRTATASVSLAVGAPADPQTEQKTQAVRGNPDSPLARFSGLVARDHLSGGVIAIALLAAMGFGAIHALSPGHGKTIVAAYLVGSKGTARHALLLGLTVTLTHTSSVYALGFITLYLSSYIVPETLYPWLGVASGALIVAMGLALFVGRARSSGIAGEIISRLRTRTGGSPGRASLAFAEAGGLHTAPLTGGNATRPPMVTAYLTSLDTHETAHHVDGHHHSHDDAHHHGVGRAHSHTMPFDNGEPVTWRRLIGLGIFGGLLPCPSAIVVMLSAISLHRVGFGLVLIVAFSLGLAGVLTGIGFALVYGRRLAVRVPFLNAEKPNPLAALAVRLFPVGSAAAVVLAGSVIGLRAIGQL